LDFAALLRQSLVAGALVDRYNKVWRVGPLIDVPDRPGSVSSRIGYEDSTTRVQWDPASNDWVEVEFADGTVYAFVLDVENGALAYQAPTSVALLSAFQALLNAQGHGRWRVQSVMVEQSWSEWRASVDRVSRLRFRLQRPNPNFDGRPRIEEMVDGTHSKMVDLVLTADPDDLEGVDLEAEYVKQALAHAVDKGYGYVKADGEQRVGDHTVDRRYDSLRDGSERIEQLPADPSGSVGTGALSEALDTVVPDPSTEAALPDDDDLEDEDD